MKSTTVLLLLMTLVAGIAVRGSQAQPLPQPSVAFTQCQAGGRHAACQPLGPRLTGLAVEGLEASADTTTGAFSTAGDTDAVGSDAAPERWRELIQLALLVTQFVVDHWDMLRGGMAEGLPSPLAMETLFDPR